MITIRQVKAADIFCSPNAPALFEEYAEECLVDISPQIELYHRMEADGMLKCFGVYQETEELIGFASVLSASMPHNGRKVATVESLFVSRASRQGLGLTLFSAMEEGARAEGCACLLYTARVGSELEWLLQHRQKYQQTHTVFMRSFQ